MPKNLLRIKFSQTLFFFIFQNLLKRACYYYIMEHIPPVLKSTDVFLIPGPESVMVGAFASEAGGAGSNPGRVIPKTLKMVPVATLLGAQH